MGVPRSRGLVSPERVTEECVVGRSGAGAVSTTLVIAAGAALLALAAVVLVLVRRSGAPAPEPSDNLVRAVDEMRLKMDELSNDLSEALERTRAATDRQENVRVHAELNAAVVAALG